jgi:hypothetical protein
MVRMLPCCTLHARGVSCALLAGLHVIACIGEKLDEREAGRTAEACPVHTRTRLNTSSRTRSCDRACVQVCFAQLAAMLTHVPDWSKVRSVPVQMWVG